MEVQGNRMVKLKNAWGHGEWNGSLSERDLMLPEEMKRALN